MIDSRSKKPIQTSSLTSQVTVGPIYITESAQVRSSSPDATFQYNQGSQTATLDESSVEYKIVYKFEEQTPVTKNYAHLLLGHTGYTNISGEAQDNTERSWQVISEARAIKTDFDCSAITWNTLSGLTVQDIGVTFAAVGLLVKGGGFGGSQPQVQASYDPYGLIQGTTNLANMNNAYGIEVRISTVQITPATAFDWDATALVSLAVGSPSVGFILDGFL